MKLNVGCGTDYREGFINIDGSTSLPKIDKIINLDKESLLNHFPEGQAEFILANDIIEHHYHWEAVRLLKDMYLLLKKGGILEIRVPDAEWIIKTFRLSIDQKLTYLFGGQDIPQGIDKCMDESRKLFPQYFCHKFGWTRQLMQKELNSIGFSSVNCRRVATNFVTLAIK